MTKKVLTAKYNWSTVLGLQMDYKLKPLWFGEEKSYPFPTYSIYIHLPLC